MAQMEQNVKEWAARHRETLLWLAFVLLTLPHFNLMNHYHQVESFINIARTISALITGIWLVFFKRRLSPLVLLVSAWQGYLLLNTLIRGGDFTNFKTCLIVSASIVSIVMLYDLMQDKQKIFFSSQIFCFELMIYINMVTAFLFPDGLYASTDDNLFGVAVKHYYFLGYDSYFFNYCIPALLLLSLWKVDTKIGKSRKIALIAAIYLTAFRMWAVATMAAICVIGLSYLFLKKLPSIVNYFSIWLIPVCFFVCVPCLRLQNHFRWLIDDVLGKWGSLMGRVSMWEFTMEKISHTWLFGCGYVDSYQRQAEMNVYYGAHAHNMLLELLYQGGAINLVFFIAIIILAGRHVYRKRRMTESKLVTVAFLGLCLATLVDVFRPFVYIMFVIAYYSNRDALLPGEKDPLDIPKWDEWLRDTWHHIRGRIAQG